MASEDTLLWRNASPTSSFTSGSVPLNNCLEHFKYLVFIFKIDYSAGSCGQMFKVMNQTGYHCYFDLISDANVTYTRDVVLTNDTSIYFYAGRYNGSENNGAMIPLEIWGTNNL